MSVNTLLHSMTEEVQETGGEAIKRAIHVARAKADITSDTQLALQAGVSYDTLMNWYGNRTTPRPAELKKVADTLGVRYIDLMDAWEGRDPQPPDLIAVIGQLVDEIRVAVVEMRMGRVQQEEQTAALLRAMGASIRGGRAPRETPDGSEPEPRAGSRRP